MCPHIKAGLCNSVGIQMILIIPAGYPPPASSPTCREGVWKGGGGALSMVLSRPTQGDYHNLRSIRREEWWWLFFFFFFLFCIHKTNFK